MDEDKIQIVASKHAFSPDAVKHLYHAMLVGKGTMAQFSHPEFGGTGQWMRGGMLMMGFQAFLAENLLCAMQPLILLTFYH